MPGCMLAGVDVNANGTLPCTTAILALPGNATTLGVQPRSCKLSWRWNVSRALASAHKPRG